MNKFSSHFICLYIFNYSIVGRGRLESWMSTLKNTKDANQFSCKTLGFSSHLELNLIDLKLNLLTFHLYDLHFLHRALKFLLIEVIPNHIHFRYELILFTF